MQGRSGGTVFVGIDRTANRTQLAGPTTRHKRPHNQTQEAPQPEQVSSGAGTRGAFNIIRGAFNIIRGALNIIRGALNIIRGASSTFCACNVICGRFIIIMIPEPIRLVSGIRQRISIYVILYKTMM